MATYYVRPDGNDANAGTGPAASQAWKTLGKALGVSGIASGDTVYVAPGVYRQTLSIGVTPSVETKVLGDPEASQFTDLLPGEVKLTAYTAGDTSAPSALDLVDANGKSFLTWERFTFVGGVSVVVRLSNVTNWTFRDCVFYGRIAGGSEIISHTTVAGAASNHLFERCAFFQLGGGFVYSQTSTLHTADYDVNIVFRRCLMLCMARAINISSTTGAGIGKPGGVDAIGCTFIVGNIAYYVSIDAHSTTIPSVVRYCVFGTGTNTSLYSTGAGTIDENWNRFVGPGARSNVAAGANSLATDAHEYAPSVGQERLWGAALRPFLTPMAGSPLLGFVSSVEAAPAFDLTGRPAPAGGKSLNFAVGALERHDTAERETVTVDAGGAIKIVGPGDHNLLVAVDAASTTITIKCRYDANHGTTTPPQLKLLANGNIGVAEQTVTAPAVVDTWHTLSLTAFTPTAKGVVVLRLISRPAAATGAVYWDTVTVS